jgi:hypothetical protein
VISLVPPRQEALPAPPLPESNQDETTQTDLPFSGPNSGTGITLRDIPGDWDSVTAVWTGSPEPLSDLVEQASLARAGQDGIAIARACWAVLVLTPRGLLHLGSWVLADPLRTAVAFAVVWIFYITTI